MCAVARGRSTALPEDQLKTPRRPSEEERMAKAKPADMQLSARTVQHYYDTLEAMLEKAVQWDLLKKNPMDKVDRPIARKKKVNYLTEERAVELLRCLHDEPNMCYRAALLLALLCGLRLGEVGALRLSDVDWVHGTIDISHALKYTPQAGNFEGAPKSEAGERLISLPASMMAVLHETREYQRDAKAWAGDVWVGKVGSSTLGTARSCTTTRPANGFAASPMLTVLKACAFTTCAHTRHDPAGKQHRRRGRGYTLGPQRRHRHAANLRARAASP